MTQDSSCSWSPFPALSSSNPRDLVAHRPLPPLGVQANGAAPGRPSRASGRGWGPEEAPREQRADPSGPVSAHVRGGAGAGGGADCKARGPLWPDLRENPAGRGLGASELLGLGAGGTAGAPQLHGASRPCAQDRPLQTCPGDVGLATCILRHVLYSRPATPWVKCPAGSGSRHSKHGTGGGAADRGAVA